MPMTSGRQGSRNGRDHDSHGRAVYRKADAQVQRRMVPRGGAATRSYKGSQTMHAITCLGLALLLTMVPSGAGPGQEKRPAQAPTPPKAPAAVTALMPQPKSVDYGDGWLHVK